MYVRCVFFKTVTLTTLYVEIWIYILPKTYGYIVPKALYFRKSGRQFNQ